MIGLDFIQPITAAIAPNAASPAPSAPYGVGAMIYSSTTKSWMMWTGTLWVPVVGVPAGGSANQTLNKNSGTDFDYSWVTPLTDFVGLNGVINGNFLVNQRTYVTATALAAGAYGHDRWKAGASGCTYNFTQANADTTITITAGSLLQVIDPADSVSANITLAWFGTSLARVYLLGSSSPPAYSAGTTTNVAGISYQVLNVTGLTPGTAYVVEFTLNGSTATTLSLVSMLPTIPGTGPAPFPRESVTVTNNRCHRFFRRLGGVAGFKFGTGIATTTTKIVFPLIRLSEKAKTPTIALTGSTISLQAIGGTSAATFAQSAIAIDAAMTDGVSVASTSATVVVGTAYLVQAGNATTFIDVSADN